MTTIGIIGFGFVGKAVSQLGSMFELNIYDPNYPEHCNNEEAAYKSDFVFFCVPTPSNKGGSVNLTTLDSCMVKFHSYGAHGIAVIKSTVPCGTTANYMRVFKNKKILHNPEFLTERQAEFDFLNPTDIIIGGHVTFVEQLDELYKHFYHEKAPIQWCTADVAELVKQTRNSFYALKVTFFNEMYELCQKLGIDYEQFRMVLTDGGKHPWWGPEHTKVPGPDGKFGFGGSCLPKDSAGLMALAREHGVALNLLHEALNLNAVIREK